MMKDLISLRKVLFRLAIIALVAFKVHSFTSGNPYKLTRNLPTHSHSICFTRYYASINGNDQQQEILNKGIAPSRKQFNSIIISTMASVAAMAMTILPQNAFAFDGGVGGLGKTKPNTGVQFANPELIPDVSTISTPGEYNAELVTPDGTTPVLLSFYAAWPMLKSQGIESRDLANAEAAFVQVASRPAYYSNNDGKNTLKKQFFVDSVFGQAGKFGMYGTPTDVKVTKVADDSDLYLVSFTTLTPAMRESDRKAYIATKVVGDGVFMLVVGTTMGRFRNQESLLKKIADSFVCVEAPKSSLRR